MLNIAKINSELQEIAEQDREERIEDQYEELLNDQELLKQYEAMSYAADLESFSPFDTMNS